MNTWILEHKKVVVIALAVVGVIAGVAVTYAAIKSGETTVLEAENLVEAPFETES